MQWSSKLPTEPGWYWWRERPDGNAKIVWVSTAGEVAESFSLTTTPAAVIGGEWFGPLSPPDDEERPHMPDDTAALAERAKAVAFLRRVEDAWWAMLHQANADRSLVDAKVAQMVAEVLGAAAQMIEEGRAE